MKKWIMNLSLVLTTIIFILLLLEIALRFLPEKPWTIGPTNATYQLRTNEFNTTITTNEHGMREPFSISQKNEKAFRILIIGGSFAYGWGVNYENTYGKNIERILRKEIGTEEIEVINISRPGADVTNYLTFIKKYALQFQPDLIISIFVFGRDSVLGVPEGWGNTPPETYTNAKSHIKNTLSNSQPSSFLRILPFIKLLQDKKFWEQHFTSPMGFCTKEWDHPNSTFSEEHIIERYGRNSEQMARYLKLKQAGWVDKAKLCAIMPYRINTAIRDPKYWQSILGVNPGMEAIIHELWRLSHEALKEINDFCHIHHVPIFFAGVPPAYLVDPAAIAFSKQLNELESGKEKEIEQRLLTDTSISDSFINFCNTNNMKCKSYLSPIRKIINDSSEPLYFPIDSHMTANGTRVLAELITKDIKILIKEKT